MSGRAMTTRAYSHCNSGHYFMGEFCPFDGLSSPASKELTVALKRLARSGRQVSLEELRKAGVSEVTLARTIVIEFGSSASAFEAVSPEDYVVNGETIALKNLDENFT
jgi:hypothetical protein